MVGNDVVDLRDRDTDPRTLHARFDGRVFAASEQEQLASCDDPVALRWTLWAAKEATYKVLVKEDPGIVFSPSRFVVALAAGRDVGVVEAGSKAVPFRVAREEGAIHVVATSRATPVVAGLERLADAEVGADELGHAVRRLARERIAAALGRDPSRVALRKRSRIPELLVDGEPAAADVSLSHHGAVVGFACELSSTRRAGRDEAVRLLGSAS